MGITMRPQKTSDEEMLIATRRCIMQHGISVSTQVIAKEIGVSQATLFKRFGTKEALLQKALLQPIVSHSIFQVLEQEPTLDTVVDQMKELSLALLRFFDEMLPNLMMLRSSGFDLPSLMKGDDTPPILIRKKLMLWIEALQKQQKIRAVSSEAFALALLGSIQHRVFRRHIIHDHSLISSDEEYITKMVDLFWLGIATGDSQ